VYAAKVSSAAKRIAANFAGDVCKYIT
jgi:hypothetical protein